MAAREEPLAEECPARQGNVDIDVANFECVLIEFDIRRALGVVDFSLELHI